MSHYDKFYEERADETREEQRKKQENCQHTWTPIACDDQGRTTEMKCLKCHKHTILG